MPPDTAGAVAPLPSEDLQGSEPTLRLSLTRAGIARSAKSIRVLVGGSDLVVRADMTCSVDLPHDQKGVHMSRFEEVANDAIREALLGDPIALGSLAERIAVHVGDRQGANRARVDIRATYATSRAAPVSGLESQETYGLIAIAAAGATGARHVSGVTAQGMNACPCAQGLLADQARGALLADGFTGDEADRVLSLVPVATHNQRALGTLLLGSPSGHDLSEDLLVRIVEDGMSSEIYELMKRTDERYVVDRAHLRPRFVEDSVREMIRGVLEIAPGLPDEAFVSATQLNFETIHAHDVEAARAGTLGEIRAELAGAPLVSSTGLDDWLAADAP